MNLLGNNKEHKLSMLTDPFKSDTIDSINIRMSSWGGKKEWSGRIEFQNGNTGGTFKTKDYPADQFDNCVLELKKLIKSL